LSKEHKFHSHNITSYQCYSII